MDTFTMGGNLLMMKFNYVFARFVTSNSDINLKFNKGSDEFIEGSNWYPLRVIGIFDV